jgi:hypothetical protein
VDFLSNYTLLGRICDFWFHLYILCHLCGSSFTTDLKLIKTNKAEKSQKMEDTSTDKKETEFKTVDKIIEEESKCL